MVALVVQADQAGKAQLERMEQMRHGKVLLKTEKKAETVVLVEMDADDEGKEYCAWLNDGTKVEFDLQGEWKRVSRNKTGVPSRLVPPVITEYVKTNYPQDIISKLSKKSYGYKIELSDDMDLRFDPQGNFIEEVD